MAWPKKVPILDADDICRFAFNEGNKHCLVGWIVDTFGGRATGLSDYEYSREGSIVADEIIKDVNRWPMNFNDDITNSSEDIAKVWNKTMRNLGYTVPCGR